MKIGYIGHSCFLLETNAGTRILTDPFDGIGWQMPRVRADYVCCTHGHFDHSYLAGAEGCRAVVSSAGTYTIDAAGALGYVRALRPKITVPMHYKTEDCTLDIAPVSGFTALCGNENCMEADGIDTDDMAKYCGKTLILRRKTDGR